MERDDGNTEQPGPLDKEGRAQWVLSKMQEAKTASADWRKHAHECFAFYAGEQWSDEDIAVLNEQRRIPVVFNRIARTVNSVVGLEISNRTEVRFLPREVEDSGFNEMLNDAAKWARDLCDAEDEESEAFRDLNICGMGWTETTLDYEEDPDGRIVVEHVDPLECYWDPSAYRKNLRDARWVARVRKMSKDAVKELWPDYEGGGTTDEWVENNYEAHDASPPFDDQEKDSSNSSKNVEVIKFMWYEREPVHRVLTTQGRIVEFDDKRWKRVKEQVEAMGLRHVEQKHRAYKVAYVIGDKCYGEEDLETQDGFTLNAMTGMKDRNHRTWFGLVALMKDPQQWANKWLSQVMHIMNSNAKGGLLAELGAFVDQRRAEDDWSRADSIIWLNDGGLTKINERSQGQFPAGFERLMQHAIDAIHDTPGVNQEMLGLVGHEQPGVLESMRKQAGVQLLAVLFDAVRLYRKEQGRVLAEMIREYISDGRLIRIVGDDGARYVPLMRDAVSFDYDVVVDEAPTSHNQKERVMLTLMHLVPSMAQAGMPPPPPSVLEYLPLPESLVQEWLGATKPSPEQVAQQQMEMQQARAVELREKAAKAQLDEARALKERVEAEALARGDNYEAAAQLAVEREKAQIKAATDIEVARIRAESAARIEQMKAECKLAESAETSVIAGLNAIAAGNADQAAKIGEAMAKVMESINQAQNVAELVNIPRRRQVNVIRDERGNIVGAEVADVDPKALN